jgi:hypothetical protein
LFKSLQNILLTMAMVAIADPAAGAKLFVPKLEPWAMWEPADESSTVTVDHSAWQELLDAYLITDTSDGIYRFSYATVSAADRDRLDAYLFRLAAIDPRTLRRAEQMPYWINMYNAVTVQVVLEHYPVKSIRKIYGGLLGTGPWNEPLINVTGQALSLNDIEHRILRPIWRDPRIHYAVNCASMGCPNLATAAFTAANTEALLDQSARSFINHPRGVTFENGRLKLSSIYDWYDSDFGTNQRERLDHLREYAEPALAAGLADYAGRIQYDYGWDLNEP